METTLLVKQEVFVYQIPPRTTAKGYRADEWNLAKPLWTGRLRMTSAGDSACNIRLEDRQSGELYANCPVDSYPGVAIESVTDSSRYFVLRVVGDGGRSAFLGIGFSDRSDSFDLSVALQDHFKWARRDEQDRQQQAEGHPPPQPLDLGFKDGQTIKINMKITKKKQARRHGNDADDDDFDDADDEGSATARAAPCRTPLSGGGAVLGGGLLPPPPSAPATNRVSNTSTPTLSPTTETAKSPSTTPSGGVSSNWVQF